MIEIKESKFIQFPKIPRLHRECVISEKIDGTNGVIKIDADGGFFVGSRTRWITPQNDNYGFAAWAMENKEELMRLGEGTHFGEWWGKGIQRNYGLSERRFSLFNTSRWGDDNIRPRCCHVVPVIDSGTFDTIIPILAINRLRDNGSFAAPGFLNPEGIVIYHVAAKCYFKKTIDRDDSP